MAEQASARPRWRCTGHIRCATATIVLLAVGGYGCGSGRASDPSDPPPTSGPPPTPSGPPPTLPPTSGGSNGKVLIIVVDDFNAADDNDAVLPVEDDEGQASCAIASNEVGG